MRTPPFCAICTASLRIGARKRRLGKGGALVAICAACDQEHPRDGRYAFEGSEAKGRAGVNNAEGTRWVSSNSGTGAKRGRGAWR